MQQVCTTNVVTSMLIILTVILGVNVFTMRRSNAQVRDSLVLAVPYLVAQA